ncbi:MAG: serine O-acetyltransferase EpsC [Spirochaetota bacterium]
MTKFKKHDHANNIQGQLIDIIEELCSLESYNLAYHQSRHESPMPSIEDLEDIVDILRSVLFPGYFGDSNVKPETMRYYLGAAIDKIFISLSEQIKRGLCFMCQRTESECQECDQRSRDITVQFLNSLGKIRHLLSTDVQAAFEGDPATETPGEIIFCYPSIRALINYRIAHELFKHEVPFIPRIISEMAHSATGIDIHPGAEIGESFFIDHGTGVVIGATCIIGKNVRLYQGVTLGAKSFRLDKAGNPVKGIPRHPIVEDDVIIYSGATLLGRITIGKGAVIGGNVWVTDSVPPAGRVLQRNADFMYEGGAGI